MKYFSAILAFFMLAYVLIVYLTFSPPLGKIVVGLVAGLMVAACAVAVYVFEKSQKGEVR